MNGLEIVGWRDDCSEAFAALGDVALAPGRVFGERRGTLSVFDGARDLSASIAGRLRHRSKGAGELPTVGDFVAFRPAASGPAGAAIVQAVLPRRSKIARKSAGDRADEQVLAANVDLAVVVSAMDGDVNPRRIERYLALARAGGVEVLILLTKVDLVPDAEAQAAEVRAVAPGVVVESVRLLEAPLPQVLVSRLTTGRTAVLLGSSGVGKSTLLNRLMGTDIQATSAVRASDRRGRHTTTFRQMFRVGGGALVIDTPGLRELQLLDQTTDLEGAFPDIVALAAHCRFRDCRHDAEPRCAVVQAEAEGRLSHARLRSYRALRAELESAAARRSRHR